jgi:pyruvate kinase
MPHDIKIPAVGESVTSGQISKWHFADGDIVNQGDVYAITCGEPMGSPGGTNMLKICKVG